MALITLGGLSTVGWAVFKYRRIPYRLYQWYNAEETEPLVGQIWMEAGLSPKDKKWKVTEIEEDTICLIEDREGEDLEELELIWDDWSLWVKKSRLYCSDKNDTIADKYWGAAADD